MDAVFECKAAVQQVPVKGVQYAGDVAAFARQSPPFGSSSTKLVSGFAHH